MNIRLSGIVERLRSSLFFVPMLFVLAGGALGVALVDLDGSLQDDATSLPFVLTSTVDSAREVLSVVAAATVTVAGIAFSVTLLVIQQASAQYSPRVVQSLFRDPFNRRVVGLSVGTFTYCLMVLRAVRTSVEGSEALSDPVIPNLAVGVAVLLGVVSILAIVAFIDHNAHSMEVGQILSRVTRDTRDQIDRRWTAVDDAASGAEPGLPAGDGHVVLFDKSGWVQRIDDDSLCRLIPDGGTVRLDTAAGRYAIEGTPMCTLWPRPDDEDAVAADARSMVRLGSVRTMEDDPAYGIRQLADVALVALSPGVNDPTTAQDAIFPLADVLRAALVTGLPPTVTTDERDRTIVRGEHPTAASLVDLSFDEIRRASSSMPTVSIYLLEALHLVHDALLRADRPTSCQPIRRQADLVLAGAERSELLDADLALVRSAHARRFGTD